jgi:hypothetical protein
VSSEKLGRANRLRDAQGRYIEFCKGSFPNELDLRGMKIVVDSAHGAAYAIASHVYHELGAEVISIGATPDGFNINAGFGATAPKAMAAAVVEHKADLGIALDGDADRLIMCDATGRLYNGDELLYVMVRDRMATGPVAGAVGTLMTNMALEVAFKQLGRLRARESRRPLRARSHERKKLAIWWRRFGSPVGTRQAYNWRRHCVVTASPVGTGPQWQDVGSIVRRTCSVSANLD